MGKKARATNSSSGGDNPRERTKSKSGSGEHRKDDQSSSDQQSNGCISPAGCLIGTPVDPSNPADSIRVTCSNGARCPQIGFIHGQCFEAFEAFLLRTLDAHAGQSRRGSTWTEQQKVNNLWNKKGYEVLYKACRCPCGGYLHKDVDYRPPTNPAAADDQQQNHNNDQANNNNKRKDADNKKKQARKTAAEKALPKLQQPSGHRKITQTMPNMQPAYRRDTGSCTLAAAIDHYFPEEQHDDQQQEKEAEDALPYIPGLPMEMMMVRSSSGRHAAIPAAPTTTNNEEEEPSLVHGGDSPIITDRNKNRRARRAAAGRRASDGDDPQRRMSSGSAAIMMFKPPNGELVTVQDLLMLLNAVIPDGTCQMSDIEDEVNQVLQYASVDILGMIEDEGGFWDWIQQQSVQDTAVPFQITVIDQLVIKEEKEAAPSVAEDDKEESVLPPQTPSSGSPAGDDFRSPSATSMTMATARTSTTTNTTSSPIPPISPTHFTVALVDPNLLSRLEAHIEPSPYSRFVGSVYFTTLKDVRLLARKLGARAFW